MMHAMAHWNWVGISFCLFVAVMVCATGWANERLRRWAETPEPVKPVKYEPGEKEGVPYTLFLADCFRDTPMPAPAEFEGMKLLGPR